MYTLFDFITHVKTIEYLIAVSFIALFIVYWEVFKPKPFKSMISAGKDDLDHIKKTGYNNTLKSVGMVISAPFIGLLYIIALPFVFFLALGTSIVYGAYRLAGGTSATFGWRPMEAYLSGKKVKQEAEQQNNKTSEETN